MKSNAGTIPYLTRLQLTRLQAAGPVWRATKTAAILGALISMQLACKTAVSLPAKAISTTAKTTGKVAGTAIKTSGKVGVGVTKATVKTAGSAAASGAKAAASLAKVPMVTFKDTATGVIKQVPWTRGLKLYAASKTAEFNTYLKAFTIFRDGGKRVIRSDWHKIKGGKPEPELKAGDYVEIAAHH